MVTAEYAMLPASTNTRSDRESVKGRIGGRTHEISRLVGRSLRAVIDYRALGENTIVLDCDVLQADGGTRTAAITGAYVALADACTHLAERGALRGDPLSGSVAAISVGIIDGEPRLDLPYEEDVRAETDMNVVMTGEGAFVEVQGTAEGPRSTGRCSTACSPWPRRAAPTSPCDSTRPSVSAEPPRPAGGLRVFLASRNPKKLLEMRRILLDYVPDLQVLGLDDVRPYDEPAETEPTFAGNALLKARAAVAATGLPSLADDSGLCVDALNGMPGVLSARWSGSDKNDAANNTLLLQQLADVPDERRTAHFTCAVAFVHPAADGGTAEHVVHGEMAGRVIREMRGARGFGYDVLFVADEPPGDERTSAELSVDEKDAISHRGKALREIAPVVAGVLKAD